jgi:hexosaminidase
MKYFTILIIAICISCSNSKLDEIRIAIIPKPDSVIVARGFYKLDKKAAMFCPETVPGSIVDVFTDEVKDFLQLEKGKKTESAINIIIEPGKKPEGYSINVKKDGIFISASTLHGAFYGLQSLRQLIIYSEKKNDKLFIPCCSIDDAPAFSWRGIMLDESRHFFGIEKVKQLLDMMAFHKLNVFHWHLTDVPGWRLEIKKYPKLTTVGGIGNQNDPDAPAKFYSQEQIKEIVKYAQERFIQVIPEIDMPGHAGASNRAYPEFSGGGSLRYPEFTFNPGKDGTYSYLTDILKEVSQLFPSNYIHLGGDEVNFGNQQWNSDKFVKKLMKKHNLTDLKAVEKYFVRRMADTIKSLNKTTIGWDEIIDLKLNPEDAVVMWWRHDKPGQLKEALENKYRVILCPRIPLYFDFVQFEMHKWGRKTKGKLCDSKTVYNFPPDTLPGVKEYRSQVLGMQANIWTEVIQNNKRLDFMTYPRISALAEAAWTKPGNKNYVNFLIRLKPLLNYLKEKDIYYFDLFNPESSPEPAGPEKN